MQIYWTTIEDIIEETPQVKTYLLKVPEGFTWEEGAHTHFALEGFNAGEKPNRSLIRHMSISTLPNENYIGITTRIKEQCSEFKSILRNMERGEKVAIFKTSSNVPFQRHIPNVYLLSSGVGLATFRPLILQYLEDQTGIEKLHSLNVDSTKDYLYPNVFESVEGHHQLISEFVDNRADYYERVKQLAEDRDGLFYIVGSDQFLEQNIEILRAAGIKPEQMMLDKHPHQREAFFKQEKMA